ncbi:PKD domain-containing protein [Gracilimonas sp.]|uniref:PKD domain-containing protein n=1 Tax=Gracilimonas sp. TaxID=1974203 RepID=UPI003D0E4648
MKNVKTLLSMVLFAGLLITSCQKSPTSAVDEPEMNAASGLSGDNVAHNEAPSTASSNGVIIIDSFDEGAQSVGPLTGFFASQRTGRDLYEGSGPIGDRRELAGSENSPGTVNLSVSGSTPGEMVAAYSGSSTHSSLIDLRYGSCSDPILSGQKRSIVWGEVTCDPTTYQLDLDLSGLTSFEIDFTNMQGGSKWSAGIYLSSGTGNNFFYREVEIPFQTTPFTFTVSASDFSGITEADLADIDGIIVTMGNNGNVASGGNVTISEVRANVESAEPVTNVYISDESVLTYDHINVPTISNWQAVVCKDDGSGSIGLDDPRWTRTADQTAFNIRPLLGSNGLHPFEEWWGGLYSPDNFGAGEWINSEYVASSNEMNPDGAGFNWTRYEMPVEGNGTFKVSLIADNCSWIYLDDQLIGYQDDAGLGDPTTPISYGVDLDGPATLSFIIFDGGGVPGGKFRLETTTEDVPEFEQPVNNVPKANAGADISKDATGSTTSVTLDGSGSSDPDGDALTYSWSDGSSVVSTDASFTADLADGEYTFTLTVSDGEATDSDDVTVTVLNTTPSANAGADQTVEAIGPTTPVTLSGSGTDADGDDLTYSWSNGDTGATTIVNLGVGEHTFTLTVTDEQGAAGSDEVIIEITDTTAPVISYSQQTDKLWPPNHKMVLVATGITATDLVDGAVDVQVTVSSSESSNGKGDGNTDSDYEIQANPDGSYDVYVRAERSGKGGGRTYSILMTTIDAAGNESSESFDVSVAKSQGRTK